MDLSEKLKILEVFRPFLVNGRVTIPIIAVRPIKPNNSLIKAEGLAYFLGLPVFGLLLASILTEA
jgi:hypothetical protein